MPVLSFSERKKRSMRVKVYAVSKLRVLENVLHDLILTLLRHLLRVFFVEMLHIYTLHLTTFFLNKKTRENVKNVKKRDLNKKSNKCSLHLCYELRFVHV